MKAAAKEGRRCRQPTSIHEPRASLTAASFCESQHWVQPICFCSKSLYKACIWYWIMLLYYSLRAQHSLEKWRIHLLWAFGKTWLLHRSGLCFTVWVGFRMNVDVYQAPWLFSTGTEDNSQLFLLGTDSTDVLFWDSTHRSLEFCPNSPHFRRVLSKSSDCCLLFFIDAVHWL